MQISAPGKLILAGEYAVLDGAPGLVMAVDRRARVSLEPSSDEHWQVTSAGSDPQEQFHLREGWNSGVAQFGRPGSLFTGGQRSTQPGSAYPG
ncbi:MAG: hypothetical protein OQK99_11185 [Gammaproteobacteria bacterium]|nr:hypothetical protein [Gammaproteobacteria bacterium]